MKITFRINYMTEWGQSIWLSGSEEAIGSWEPRYSFPLTYVGNGEWEATLQIDAAESFEYKYFLKSSSNRISWEGGKNRTFHGNGFVNVEVRDFWHSQVDEDSVLFSKLFTEVLFKRESQQEVKGTTTAKKVIRFTINQPRVRPGQSVGLTGNCKPLGIWNHPVVMDGSRYPLWSVDLELKDLHFPIEYKYVIVNDKTGQIDLWEEGGERSIRFMDTNSDGFIHIQNDEKFKFPTGKWKGSGVAVPVFSLRTEDSYGVGEFNDLKKLADWAKATGLKVIQVLPINETVATHSWLDSYPYKAISVFALHPMYLNLDKLGKIDDEKIMDEFDMVKHILNAKTDVDYIEVTRAKSKYYKLIFDQTWEELKETEGYKKFFEANSYWLEDYAAFCFLRDSFKTANFRLWDKWAVYDKKKVEKLVDPGSGHFEHIAVHYFIQYHLDKQLKEAVEYGHSLGIGFKGDIPIGISPNSIEAWTQPDLFNLNGQAGAPPDDFAVLGQNWGFPTYNWEKMAEDGFDWWKKRLRALANYFDAYRIDHILGFFRIWEIPQDSMHGLLGYFRPGLPLMPEEIMNRGIDFDVDRFTKPYIRGHFLHELFGEFTEEVKREYLVETGDNYFVVKPGFTTQKMIYNHFTPNEEEEEKLSEKNIVIRDGLISLLDEVLFIKDPYCPYTAYHPRISMQYSYSFRELDQYTKNVLDDVYIDFFYKRHEDFWMHEAYKKLPSLIGACDMLVCGEDLGMVPDCVTEVMKNLNILSLEIQRMPKNPKLEFAHPADAPYLSVCTTSTHDMSTIRGWWEENRDITQRFYNRILGHSDYAPYYAEPWICKEILLQHLFSPAMLTIFPIQDLISMDGELRWDETDKERINVPSDEKNKWRYRMVLSLEELLEAKDFNSALKNMVHISGRE